MEKPNVNNLNGVPNFGHGLPEDLTGLSTNAMNDEQVEQGAEGVQEPQPEENVSIEESAEETDNG